MASVPGTWRLARGRKPATIGPADWLKRVADTGQPVVITQNGKAAGVLVSPAEFDRLRERAGLLEAIDVGLADEQAGRVVPHAAVVSEMQRRAASTSSCAHLVAG
jgi:prevent-host-death family protein